MKNVYSLCESVHASGESPWHIRRLTDVGRKLGGGIDTGSLCGLVKQGWDLKVEIDEHHLSHACPKCVEIYRLDSIYSDSNNQPNPQYMNGLKRKQNKVIGG